MTPEFRYRQTTATLDVRGFAFRAAGRRPIDLGWRAAFPDWKPADEKSDDAQLLPALHDGEAAQPQNPTTEDEETRPPPRYNEGTLIEAVAVGRNRFRSLLARASVFGAWEESRRWRQNTSRDATPD